MESFTIGKFRFSIFNKRFEYPTEDKGCSVVII